MRPSRFHNLSGIRQKRQHVANQLTRLCVHEQAYFRRNHRLFTIVRVHYFVRGGFVRHRSRASSKHLSPSSSGRRARFLGGQTGVALHLQMHVWVSVYKETDQMLLFSRSNVTALTLSYGTFPLRKV
ncbi:hypothetical protein TNCV_969881 [Trichonephila clavipes]|nr:hypothetical protein TNCV_969881 [Trichonephila clavipes]